MGLVSGYIKFKAIKNGIKAVRNIFRKKAVRDDAVKPYRTRATY